MRSNNAVCAHWGLQSFSKLLPYDVPSKSLLGLMNLWRYIKQINTALEQQRAEGTIKQGIKVKDNSRKGDYFNLKYVFVNCETKLKG